jgi:hypothetical protein
VRGTELKILVARNVTRRKFHTEGVATVQNLVTWSMCSYEQRDGRTDNQADKQFLDYSDYCVESPTLLGKDDWSVLWTDTNMNT